MERRIKLADIEAAVSEAYSKFKKDKDGEVSPELEDVKKKQFAISVVLADGTVIEKGDTSAMFALGDLIQIPVATLLLSENSPEELLKKSGAGECPAKMKGGCGPDMKALRGLPLQPRLLRAVSAIEPTGDPEGKMEIIVNNLTAMTGVEPSLDDALYKSTLEKAHEASTENVLTEAGYFLYDDAAIAVDLVSRLESLKYNTTQLATMGASILADGFNPVTKTEVFDGAVSERIVAMMATFGPARQSHGWLISSGVPAMASFSGGMLGVVPGVMSIAAYSPLLNEKGFSLKASHAIRYVANKLGINTFGSSRVIIEK